MTPPVYAPLSLVEYVPRRLPRQALSDTEGELLWKQYIRQIDVVFPSPKTGWEWELKSDGWVGYIPLSPDHGISLLPRVSLRSLFGMLDYAYHLPLHIIDGVFHCQSLPDFYERLAQELARRVRERERRGFHRDYVGITEELSYVTGQVNVQRMIRQPWSVRLECTYQDHTLDIEDNRILAWTLGVILRSDLCSERVVPQIRHVYRSLQGGVTQQAFRPNDCINRLYHRLNSDYQPMHALCRFFLEHSGPGIERGDRRMLPFLVHMPRLYEQFVAEWLKAHLPKAFRIKTQERYNIAYEGSLYFAIDLVLYDVATDKAYGVIDTKYKIDQQPKTADIAQVVAYAQAKGCQHAFLAYPKPLLAPLDTWIGKIRVRSVTFALTEDIEQAGQNFLCDLLGVSLATDAGV